MHESKYEMSTFLSFVTFTVIDIVINLTWVEIEIKSQLWNCSNFSRQWSQGWTIITNNYLKLGTVLT